MNLKINLDDYHNASTMLLVRMNNALDVYGDREANAQVVAERYGFRQASNIGPNDTPNENCELFVDEQSKCKIVVWVMSGNETRFDNQTELFEKGWYKPASYLDRAKVLTAARDWLEDSIRKQFPIEGKNRIDKRGRIEYDNLIIEILDHIQDALLADDGDVMAIALGQAIANWLVDDESYRLDPDVFGDAVDMIRMYRVDVKLSRRYSDDAIVVEVVRW